MAELGARLDLTTGNFIGMVERGERLPSDELVLRMAHELDVSERELLSLKYEAQRGSEVGRLLAPPSPRFPRLRRFLLGTCLDRPAAKDEFDAASRGALERLAWKVILQHALLPALEDHHAPTSLRRHVSAWKRRRRDDPTAPLDPAWFESHADLFVPWARAELEGWTVDLGAMTFTLRRPPARGGRLVVDLAPPPPESPAPRVRPDLAVALESAGLLPDDVEEMLALVEIKRRRNAARGAD